MVEENGRGEEGSGRGRGQEGRGQEGRGLEKIRREGRGREELRCGRWIREAAKQTRRTRLLVQTL
eukprot:746756-Hanusia_phi.AAC.2